MFTSSFTSAFIINFIDAFVINVLEETRMQRRWRACNVPIRRGATIIDRAEPCASSYSNAFILSLSISRFIGEKNKNVLRGKFSSDLSLDGEFKYHLKLIFSTAVRDRCKRFGVVQILSIDRRTFVRCSKVVQDFWSPPSLASPAVFGLSAPMAGPWQQKPRNAPTVPGIVRLAGSRSRFKIPINGRSVASFGACLPRSVRAMRVERKRMWVREPGRACTNSRAFSSVDRRRAGKLRREATFVLLGQALFDSV